MENFEVLNLVKARVNQTQQLVQTEETVRKGIEKFCTEQFGMRRKWPIVSRDCQLWKACNRKQYTI